MVLIIMGIYKYIKLSYNANRIFNFNIKNTINYS